MIEAWASHKSFVRKDGSGPEQPPGRNPEVDFKGEKRSNATHQSSTDPQSRLYKKGEFTAKLRYMTHALAENRKWIDRRRGNHPGQWPGRVGSGAGDDCAQRSQTRRLGGWR